MGGESILVLGVYGKFACYIHRTGFFVGVALRVVNRGEAQAPTPTPFLRVEG